MAHIMRINEYVDVSGIWTDEARNYVVDELKKRLGNVVVRLDLRKSFNGEILPNLYVTFDGYQVSNTNSGCFVFRLWDGKIDLQSPVLMMMSPFDKSGNNPYNPRLKYLAMRSVDDLLKECGWKKWRNSSYKTPDDVIRKVSDYIANCITLMNLYCGGDVRDGVKLNGVLDVSIVDALNASN